MNCTQRRESRESKPSQEETERPPLPPGHPIAWLVLTEKTILEGADYPLPVFA